MVVRRTPLPVLYQVDGAKRYDFSKWPIPQHRLFNGAIARHDGKLFMAVRHFERKHYRCDVTVSEVDEDFNPVRTKTLRPFQYTERSHSEDPRLFSHNGHLWLMYVHVYSYSMGLYACSQILVKLDDRLNPILTIRPDYGTNDGENYHKEKNWVPVSHDGRLFIIYNLRKNEVFELDDETGAVIGSKDPEEGLIWPYGSFSGGTPLLPYQDGLLGMQHGFVQGYSQRIYNASFFKAEPVYPFRVTHVSKWPDVVGSPEDGYVADRIMGGWQPRCIFPGGMVETDDGVLVCAGVNDSYVYLLPFAWDKINLTAVDDFYGDNESYYYTRNQTLIPQGVDRAHVREYREITISNKPIRTEVITNHKRFICATDDIHHKSKMMAAYPEVQPIRREDYERLQEGIQHGEQDFTG